ncbi:MAG: PTS system mannose/fructose/sorbose family transporter subunit IID [Deferribacterales bacterium]
MKKILRLLRALFYTGNTNVENMQGSGFQWLVKSVAKSENIDISDSQLTKEREYFNTNPAFINFIVGIWIKELPSAEGPDYWKRVYSSAFAAVGDSLFYHSYRVFCFLVAALLGLYSPVIGLLTYLILYNVLYFLFLYKGYDIGFKYGKNIIGWFNMLRINEWGQWLDIASVFLLGILLLMLAGINNFYSYWHYSLGSLMLFAGIVFAKLLNATIFFIIGIISLALILFLGGL